MAQIGTPLSPTATKVLMCGSGELGKEVVIELQRLGVEVIAVDRYENARAITDGLGGRGLFGVELFVKGDEVYFSEVSPRPHDTGMVTLISQDLSEFAHTRAAAVEITL